MRPDPTITFQAQRPRLLRLAYRMLGSRTEAEDIVQEAWLRWQGGDHGVILDPAAWLTRVVSRLCLDQMRSARMRRETYPGTWLPEPLIEPEDDNLRPDNLTLTLMMALERLSPLERATFLLHDVFGQSMDEIAITIGRSPAATRQLAARARAHVQIDRPRYQMSRDSAESLARAFFEACRSGDARALATMLAEGASLRADGGGKVSSYPNVIEGADHLIRLFLALARKYGAQMDLLEAVVIDGLPGFVSRVGDHLQTTALQIEAGRITAIYITRNPDKLTGLRPH
ncbi:sigma-70 family RNA polymerase sigma factor (plasmid) [Gemmobacter fulvus]|uniref:Sigma-70 family RNA polymerase sigma factor n=1 Tax=Gemmobacter fulvus TaxID=2840474 RepID=A0A975S3N7_9RHOB|nr:sigma-70 family RNA polymerase sigma factor [Gemmobacter fulvus]MBT9245970.1 sigma-70 family RNA polymerase sigma factor [Gemmobacter fulvus]QWK92258.1 sigma-70 family RNA polymerase sigma factor [Gemmobacter fulvus]